MEILNARLSTLTLIRRGGGRICPTDFQMLIPQKTESRINLKSGCKFEFVCCLETYAERDRLG